jgi:hypothetical protein
MNKGALMGAPFLLLDYFVDSLKLNQLMLPVQYVTDTNGNPLYVQVPIADYEKLLADAEELADIAAYKKAKERPGKLIPLSEAFAEIDAHHSKLAS